MTIPQDEMLRMHYAAIMKAPGDFKPCKVVFREIGVTEFVFEDVAHVAQPVIEGVHHYVDWLVAMDDGRLVGMAFWRVFPEDRG